MSHPVRGGAVDFGGECYPVPNTPGGEFSTPKLPPGPGGTFGFWGSTFRGPGGSTYFEISETPPRSGGEYLRAAGANFFGVFERFLTVFKGKTEIFGRRRRPAQNVLPPAPGGTLAQNLGCWGGAGGTFPGSRNLKTPPRSGGEQIDDSPPGRGGAGGSFLPAQK